MAAQRPDPADPGTTYMDVLAIASEIRRLHLHSNEGEVNGVWNSVLNWVFDPVNGFITKPQAMHTGTGGARDFSDFHTLAVAGRTRHSFLITQCKSPDGEGKKSVWADGEAQLLRYLRMEHSNRRGPQRPAYGILAIGRRVRFFQYYRAIDDIRGWRPSRPIPDRRGDRDFYHLEREATQVQMALRDILNHH
ncbi:uncharacterized protein NFIA_002830 [Aspergillus fischeri NRRL 181]|uniref:Fungal-type protein kinase domain-containing protein n=1 Tax=Neosartorya fischeri (strain ATCC 1020 / DSM 3700 / CBS 544.65 / FGSC A1164 / JCM 1740 / NRRL 181 / WB 181) TaxID=331117 RepID=A1DJP2_NEOFI|nr:uncharacterized protein NFIA_002830 [Aspergillus fischeri NRRL 181]EAW16931.1 hypothetical protein NFIA_002830 [Aspergillus fischeri NRRL 181]KAG2019102.1 hypothetical protein GB937_005393 [Aspergillus fischeri]